MQALVAPIVAVIGGIIAWQQMALARNRLRHDVFFRQHEKKLAVYEATRTFLFESCQEGMSEEKIRTYTFCLLDAEFLFDNDTHRYLKQVRDAVAALHLAETSIKNLPAGDERNAWEKIRSEKLSWIFAQGDGVTSFHLRLAPFLVYETPSSWSARLWRHLRGSRR